MKKQIITGIISAAGLFLSTAPLALANTTSVTYTVQAGDSLYKISQQYGAATSTLVSMNQIANPNNIYVGEVLTLPFTKYTVVAGDSLSKIAQKFGVTAASIESQNKLTNPNLIYVGQVLLIPQSAAAATSSTAAATSTAPASTGTPAATSSTPTGAAIVATAESYLGAHPYVFGGNSPAGWDCSGFTSYVFAQNGITLPRVSADQATVGTPVAESDLEPGDLVFFSGTTTATAATNTVSHVGIYVGNGNFIEESSSQNAVVIASLSNTYWAAHYFGARRVL
ncbi:LysM peptidoglycan-binding domain-containing protein [Alicyclobacillus cycloheptanicus]|jgi:peptidoglycan endopeptidase LytE|uniref:Peptidoglycan endopeptidase LytE n=1 Tax=Alicyclobacillus cycloheptanicus TaxID=1457 RepID=A0ABT9XHY7_9BACL|nr:C40 family peptidase [Alicyclobacillus cycloheptanicus]MDQ0189924.1 peptidoglycan endopeptidase LytE [Alicyclobacillus cycloheptanicus]WDM02173.1 LysM peptidoglycan-binding domain-containing protein [Alicyclobacillus cycloheptanicus]